MGSYTTRHLFFGFLVMTNEQKKQKGTISIVSYNVVKRRPKQIKM